MTYPITNDNDRFLGKYFKGRNMVTPNIIAYGRIGERKVYELSQGSNLLDWEKVYGVTVAWKHDAPNPDLESSQAFQTLEGAMAHIRALKELEAAYQDKHRHNFEQDQKWEAQSRGGELEE